MRTADVHRSALFFLGMLDEIEGDCRNAQNPAESFVQKSETSEQ